MTDDVQAFGRGQFPVPAVYLVMLQEFAAERGVAPQQVLRDTGLSLGILLHPEAHVGNLSIEQAARNVSEAIDDPALPIIYGQRLTIDAHGALGFAAKNSATLAEALDLLVPFVQTRTGGREWAEVVIDDRWACVRWSTIDGVSEETAMFGALLGLISIETIGRRLTAHVDETVETQILVAHPSPGPIDPDVLPEGLTVLFDQPVTELRFPVELLERPLPHADPNLGGCRARTTRGRADAPQPGRRCGNRGEAGDSAKCWHAAQR